MTQRIELSEGLQRQTLNALIQPFRNGAGQICLMTGEVPTSLGQAPNPNPIGPTAPTTDTLVIWEGDKIFAVFPGPVVFGAGWSIPIIGLSTKAGTAIRNGTVTWFYGNSEQNDNIEFIGTVGLTGSGADLELDNVEIVQGKTYGIDSLRFTLPTSFSY